MVPGGLAFSLERRRVLEMACLLRNGVEEHPSTNITRETGVVAKPLFLKPTAVISSWWTTPGSLDVGWSPTKYCAALPVRG